MTMRLLAALAIVTLTTSTSAARADESSSPGDADQPNWQRIGGIAAVGVGAGLIGLYNFSLIQVKGVQNDAEFDSYRRTHQASADVCDAAAAGTTSDDRRVSDLCSKAHTYEVLEVISIPAAAVALTTGIILIARSGRDEPKVAAGRVDVVAGVGPTGGSVGLVGRF